MLQLRTIINNEKRYLDLYQDEDIFLDYSFAEIQDITSKNSSFTRSFTLPGSKNNNDIFQHYYDLNSSLTDYDIRSVFEASLEQNGYELMRGYIRLEKVTVDVTNVIYSVVFFSNVGLLTTNIGDKLLADIDYSSLDHEYTLDNIISSLYDTDFSGGTQPYNDGRVMYVLAGFGYDYDDTNNVIKSSTPIIDYQNGLTPGYFDNIGSPLRYYYLKPAIQIKWLYEKIFSEAGFRINSDFFNTSYFKRYFLPLAFSTDSLYLSQSIKPEFYFLNDTRSGGTITYSSNTWTDLTTSGSTTLYRGLQLPEIVNNIDAHQLSNYTFRVPSDGTYTLRISYGGFNSERIPESVDLTSYFRGYLHQIELGGANGWSGTTLFSTPVISIAPGGGFSRTDTVTVFLSANYNYSLDMDLDDGIGFTEINYYSLEIIDGPRIIVGDVDLGLELPPDEYTQMDFISGINKRFNLVVVPDLDEENTFTVEPIIDFIGKGETIDWSRKLDYNSPLTISPTTQVINGTLYYNSAKDEDYGNQEFTKATNVVYGSRFKQLDTRYKNSKIEFVDGFSNAVDDVLNNLSRPSITIPIFYITKETNNEGEVLFNYVARKTIPRLLFRGLNLPAYNVGYISDGTGTTVNNFYIENQVIDMYPLFNRFITYPFGVSGLTHSINYNKEHRFSPIEFDFSDTEDAYTVYYEDYINDLTDIDSKILVAKFYLTPEEIAELKGDERIFINGNYYRINRISKYNMTSPGITEVELIKMTRSYEPHRKRCYLLRACDDPADVIYTNTDLNFTLYAYVGKKVKIGEFCYEIEEDICRDDVTYTQLTIPFQNNSFLPLLYDDCGCNTPISSVDIYNDYEIPPQPPIPTPSVSDYYYYIVEKCGEQAQLLARSTTYYPVGTGVKTAASGDICGFIFSIVTIVNNNDITSTYTNCAECESTYVTPTVTPTLTPTPTVTPTATIPSVFSYYYQAQDCDNPLLFTVVGSNTFYPIGRILKLNTGRCAEIVGTDVGPHLTTVVGSYLTCEACPR